MPYPTGPSPYMRSGWNSSLLIPNPEYHASALTYLGGTQPPTSAAPVISQRYFSGQGNPAVGGIGNTSGGGYTPPDWLTTLLFGGGLPGTYGQQNNVSGQTPSAVKGQQIALQQVANPANTLANMGPQAYFGPPKPKQKGLFQKILGFSDPAAAKVGESFGLFG